MAESPELRQVEQLYFSQAPRLFALCYLHTGGPKGAAVLLHTLLCDLLLSPRCWKQASAHDAGLFRCAHTLCMDRYWNRPRRKKKKGSVPASPGSSLPFTMTDALRALLDLPPQYKTALYLRLALGWSLEDTAQAASCSPKKAGKLVEKGLKRTSLTPERAGAVLSAITPTESGPQEVWDSFLISREDKGFTGSQRLRRFKHWLDNAIPFIALGVVSLCALAYCSVEYGWFGAEDYTPTPSGGYGADSATISSVKKTASIYSVDKGEIVLYSVTNCPLSHQALLQQMVALGGAPEGASLLSVEQEGGLIAWELSEEAVQWFRSVSETEGEQMLSAMAATISASWPDVEELHLVSAGEELAVSGKTAQDMLGQKLTPVRTVTTPYRE